jgi:hypothetical protein
MAQRLTLMAAPAPQIAEVGGTFKRQKPGQNLGHERFMPESGPPAHAAGLFHVGRNYFRRRGNCRFWE